MKLTKVVITTVALVSSCQACQALPIYQTTNTFTYRSGNYATDIVKRSDLEQKGASPELKEQGVLSEYPSSGHHQAVYSAPFINQRSQRRDTSFLDSVAARGLGGKMMDFLEYMPMKATEWRAGYAKKQFAKADAAETGSLASKSDSWWVKRAKSHSLDAKLNYWLNRKVARKDGMLAKVQTRHQPQVWTGNTITFREGTRFPEENSPRVALGAEAKASAQGHAKMVTETIG